MRKFLFMLFTTFLISCGESRPLPKTGEYCKVTSECAGAIDEESFKELYQSFSRKDEHKFNQLVASGKVFVLKPIWEYYVVEKKSGKYKLRTDRYGTIIEVWVASENVSI